MCPFSVSPLIITMNLNLPELVISPGADISYLFTRKMFSWTEATYTEVSTGVTGNIIVKLIKHQQALRQLWFTFSVDESELPAGVTTVKLPSGSLGPCHRNTSLSLLLGSKCRHCLL